MSASPVRLVSGHVPSPLGRLLVACDEQGRLRLLDLHDDPVRAQQTLRRYQGPAVEMAEGTLPSTVTDALGAFFAGDVRAIDSLPVETGGTTFQRRVWAALRRIPAGSTWSYGRLAAEVGNPAASRAVGMANGANPVAIVVPCHRVIGANGTLTGYGGGLPRKSWLLEHERKHVAPGAGPGLESAPEQQVKPRVFQIAIPFSKEGGAP